MDFESENEALRARLKACSIAEIAREVNLPPTTLYSFAKGDTQFLRADNHATLVEYFGGLDALHTAPGGDVSNSTGNDRDDQSISQRLTMARRLAGFSTAKEAAEKFGWSYPTYSKHESGSSGFSRDFVAYADAFEVELDWLVTGKGTPVAKDAVPLQLYERIKERLEKLMISESEACRRAGLAQTFIRDVRMVKKRDVGTQAISRLAAALETEPAWLAFGVESAVSEVYLLAAGQHSAPPFEISGERFRDTIKQIGVAELARASDVNAQTLYAFVQGRTENLRSDTRDKVLAAIAKLGGEDTAVPIISEITARMERLSNDQRKLVLGLIESLARR